MAMYLATNGHPFSLLFLLSLLSEKKRGMEVGLLETVRVETPTGKRLREGREAKKATNFFGRVGRDNAFAVSHLHPFALPIWLELRRHKAMKWREPYQLGATALADMGIERKVRDRALEALEAAGYVRIERHRGRLPRIWLVERQEKEAA
jgi:hypothetical protein